MSSKITEVLHTLEREGVEVEHQAFGEARNKIAFKSILVQFFAVFGSLLGLLMFIGFIALVSESLLTETLFLIGMGILFLGITAYLNQSKDSSIQHSIAISFFLIGYSFLVIGLYNEWEFIGILLTLTGLVSLGLYANQVISFLSTIAIALGIHYMLILNDLDKALYLYLSLLAIGTTGLFWFETKIRTTSTFFNNRYPAVFTALFSFSLIMSILVSTDDYKLEGNGVINKLALLLSGITLALILLTTNKIIKEIQLGKRYERIGVYLILSAFSLFIGYYVPAFSLALLYMLWSFRAQFKTGFVLCVLTFIWAMSIFYYDLEITLLEKSISLMVIGALFLYIYYLIQKKGKRHEGN